MPTLSLFKCVIWESGFACDFDVHLLQAQNQFYLYLLVFIFSFRVLVGEINEFRKVKEAIYKSIVNEANKQ